MWGKEVWIAVNIPLTCSFWCIYLLVTSVSVRLYNTRVTKLCISPQQAINLWKEVTSHWGTCKVSQSKLKKNTVAFHIGFQLAPPVQKPLLPYSNSTLNLLEWSREAGRSSNEFISSYYPILKLVVSVTGNDTSPLQNIRISILNNYIQNIFTCIYVIYLLCI